MYNITLFLGPEKRPKVPYKVVDEGNGRFRIEFTTVEVGSYVIDVTVKELTVPNRYDFKYDTFSKLISVLYLRYI